VQIKKGDEEKIMGIVKDSKVNIFLLIIAVMAICLCCSGQALADQSGDYTYTVTNNEAQITKYTGSGGAVTILGDYPVTRRKQGEETRGRFFCFSLWYNIP